MINFAGMVSGKGTACRTAAAVLLLFPFLAGCAGPMITDVMPPEARPVSQAAASGNGTVDISPLLPPDPVAGKDIYRRECSACHGGKGMGDGSRSDNLPSLPPPVGSPAYSRFVSPSRWFQVITQGRMEKLMPAYSTSLSDRQRWDTVAYLMTLGSTPEQVSAGLTVYRKDCQECHPVEPASSYNGSPARQIPEMFHKSVDELTSVLVYGSQSMNHAGLDLTAAEKDDVALYLRTLVFAQRAAGTENTPFASTKPESGVDSIAISGQVINGSGGPIPIGLTATLTGFDEGVSQFALVSPIYAPGRYSFDSVPYAAGRTFTISTHYKGTQFTSALIHADNADEIQDSRITLYEPDTDVSKVTAERVHLFFEFPRSDTLRVVQLYVLSNPTNRLITSAAAGGVVVDFPLPAEASNLQFQTGSLGQRFLFTSNGVGDTQGIPPGDGTQILFSYDLPYRGEAGFSIILPVAARSVNVMLAAEGVNLKSTRLVDIGRKDMQNSNWQLFTAQGVTAGESIMVNLSGKPHVTTPRENEMSNSLAAGIVSLVIVLVLIATIIFRDIMDKRTLSPEANLQPTVPVDHNAVLDAIIALDDQFQAGRIPAAAYRERRDELKDRLRRMP